MYLAGVLHGDMRMTAWLNGRGVKCNVRTEPFSLPGQGNELHQQTVSSMKAERAVIGLLCDENGFKGVRKMGHEESDLCVSPNTVLFEIHFFVHVEIFYN